MKNGWPEVSVEDVITLNRSGFWGDGESSPSRRNPVRVVRNADVTRGGELRGYAERYFSDKELAAARLLPNDIALSTSGEVGKAWEVTEAGYCASNFIRILRPNPKHLAPGFLRLALATDEVRNALQKNTTGATIQNLKKAFFSSATFPLPPIAEQQRIVGVLDEAFAGLATAQAHAAQNLQNARALFESNLQSVFTHRGKGWVETTVGEVCTLRSGTTVSPKLERPVGDIPYVKVADMTFDGNEDTITTSSRFLCRADVKESTIIPKGATIFPKRGGAILTNKKRITSLPICADLNIMAVIPSSKIDGGMLYFYFQNVDMRKLGTGSSIPQINNYDVAPLAISFPKSISEQEHITAQLDALAAETQRLVRLYEQKLAALVALTKSLLHQAFNGSL